MRARREKPFSFQITCTSKPEPYDRWTKELCQEDLDILVKMFTLQHIQSLDLKKFYAGPDKEWAGQEPYKIRYLCLSYFNKKPM
jgi:hypothetical protein